jgi:hypothetical protein
VILQPKPGSSPPQIRTSRQNGAVLSTLFFDSRPAIAKLPDRHGRAG